MGGDVETIKNRLDIAEIVSGYIKLEKAGASFKARCPFHSEKTPSFFISPSRQSFYCFGCGAKGDIFTFVEQVEGLDFREALKLLAERAGIELSYKRGDSKESKSEKEAILLVLEEAQEFFEKELEKNKAARDYIVSRGLSPESIKAWNIGYAPAEWRSLYDFMRERGHTEALLVKAGLIKKVEAGSGKNPYDVFRDRIMFPLKDQSGRTIAFSGRALAKETEPKYLNSPDTLVFTKHEVLYGLDKAKDKIRRKDYAVLVEGQMDLTLSHQSGVDNTVASSGTAFTQTHLERLKKFSKRIILAFDGDDAGEVASEKAAALALSLGLEVKIAELPEGRDPADMAHENPEKWKEILRSSKPAIEQMLNRIIKEEKDVRKRGKLIVNKLLPLILLLDSSVERSHFLSLIAKHTGIKEEILWDDMKRARRPDIIQKTTEVFSTENLLGSRADALQDGFLSQYPSSQSRKERIEERLTEVRLWIKELPSGAEDAAELKKEERELQNNLKNELLKDELKNLNVALASAETSKDIKATEALMVKINKLHQEMRALEEEKNVL